MTRFAWTVFQSFRPATRWTETLAEQILLPHFCTVGKYLTDCSLHTHARARVCVCLLCLCFGVCILCSGHLQSDYTHLCPLNSYKGSDAVTAHQLHLCFDSLFLFSAPFFYFDSTFWRLLLHFFLHYMHLLLCRLPAASVGYFSDVHIVLSGKHSEEKNNLKHWFR